MTYKVVVRNWFEPEWECFDGCCWEPGERRWIIAESNIPWNNAGKGEYEHHTVWEWVVYVELLTGLYTNDFLMDVMAHEDFEERLKKLLDEAGVEIEWVDIEAV